MMASYPNGRFPLDWFEVLGEGVDQYGPWQWLAPPGTAVRWRWLVAAALENGVLLRPSPGFSFYRPFYAQEWYYAEHGPGWAAVPGYSSHGGDWNGRDCCAIDVNNWAELGWAKFSALCREAGFTVDFVSPQELWHIGDFDPWNIPPDLKEEDMTPEQSQKLDAIYAGLFGPKNLGAAAGPLGWKNWGGDTQKSEYGLLPIEINTQQIVAKQGLQLTALQTAVAKLEAHPITDEQVAAIAKQVAAELGTVGGASADQVEQIVLGALGALVLVPKG